VVVIVIVMNITSFLNFYLKIKFRSTTLKVEFLKERGSWSGGGGAEGFQKCIAHLLEL
jgi:hypothetical protein